MSVKYLLCRNFSKYFFLYLKLCKKSQKYNNGNNNNNNKNNNNSNNNDMDKQFKNYIQNTQIEGIKRILF